MVPPRFATCVNDPPTTMSGPTCATAYTVPFSTLGVLVAGTGLTI